MARGSRLGGITLFSSYHCSRYNTNTGVLTPAMFDSVFEAVRRFIDTKEHNAPAVASDGISA